VDPGTALDTAALAGPPAEGITAEGLDQVRAATMVEAEVTAAGAAALLEVAWVAGKDVPETTEPMAASVEAMATMVAVSAMLEDTRAIAAEARAATRAMQATAVAEATPIKAALAVPMVG
jgi:hypothetical protein